MRQLHIGPGADKLDGFETLDIKPGLRIDHVADARSLPFSDNTFELIYASHIIEHIPWYDTATALAEWFRVLTPGGALEVWTVDAYKVAKEIIEAEESMSMKEPPDGWKRYNPERNIFKWCAGRIFAYSKTGAPGDPNWHRALFTPNYLVSCFLQAGFGNVCRLEKPRGKDHGFCNLGIGGIKA